MQPSLGLPGILNVWCNLLQVSPATAAGTEGSKLQTPPAINGTVASLLAN